MLLLNILILNNGPIKNPSHPPTMVYLDIHLIVIINSKQELYFLSVKRPLVHVNEIAAVYLFVFWEVHQQKQRIEDIYKVQFLL